LFIFGLHPFQDTDRSSVANTDDIHTANITLDLSINFEERRIYGTIVHDFVSVSSGIKEVQLDVQDLVIQAVRDFDTMENLEFKLMEWPWITDESNQVLAIWLKRRLQYGEHVKVEIKFYTKPEGKGLNWLNENQTSTKQPFFYTDCQSYYCRSLAPLQDSPSIKAPFYAKIHARKPLNVLSSGPLVKTTEESENMMLYEFYQPIPVPSYLIAVLAGVLEKRQIDHRTFVYAEPSMIERSADVLSDIGTFLNIVFLYVKQIKNRLNIN